MTIRCRHALAGFELGSPDYQGKVLSATLVRDHQIKVIWVELYVARHTVSIVSKIVNFLNGVLQNRGWASLVWNETA
jgi:hypothetical protein